MLWNERDRLEGFARMQPAVLLRRCSPSSLKLLAGVLAIYAFLALGDAVYQRLHWLKRQRMSKQEIKEEYKQTEGNPEIKAKLRQIRAARAEEAHDGRRADGHRGHHQPDPLRGGAAIRARHGRAGLRRQGRRRASR